MILILLTPYLLVEAGYPSRVVESTRRVEGRITAAEHFTIRPPHTPHGPLALGGFRLAVQSSHGATWSTETVEDHVGGPSTVVVDHGRGAVGEPTPSRRRSQHITVPLPRLAGVRPGRCPDPRGGDVQATAPMLEDIGCHGPFGQWFSEDVDDSHSLDPPTCL